MGKKKIDIKEVKESAIELIGKQWMLITAGNMESHNTMTASWGALGELWYKPVAFTFIRDQRYTKGFVDANEMFTLSFFSEEYREALQLCGQKSGRDTDKIEEAGLTPYRTEQDGVAFEQARLVLECRKLYVDRIDGDLFLDKTLVERCYPEGDYHQLYISEIVGAWADEEVELIAM